MNALHRSPSLYCRRTKPDESDGLGTNCATYSVYPLNIADFREDLIILKPDHPVSKQLVVRQRKDIFQCFIKVVIAAGREEKLFANRMVWFEDNQILAEVSNIKKLTPMAIQDLTPVSETARAAVESRPETHERAAPQPPSLIPESDPELPSASVS